MTKVEVATLAGGCFWCTEAIFKRLKGVVSVTSGFSGGKGPPPSYESIHENPGGFAEAIQIEFDPRVISFTTILDVFWHTHNPTTRNRQDYDVGEEYRSAIFYHSQTQRQIAQTLMEQLNSSKEFTDPVVTEISPFIGFFPAGPDHRDFYDRHRQVPFCQIITDPKIKKLLRDYSSWIKEEYLE